MGRLYVGLSTGSLNMVIDEFVNPVDDPFIQGIGAFAKEGVCAVAQLSTDHGRHGIDCRYGFHLLGMLLCWSDRFRDKRTEKWAKTAHGCLKYAMFQKN